MSTEHLDGAEISSITVSENDAGGEHHMIGYGGITRIEAITKSGQYADIPYVRVWKDDQPYAEFCQHNIKAVYFKAKP